VDLAIACIALHLPNELSNQPPSRTSRSTHRCRWNHVKIRGVLHRERAATRSVLVRRDEDARPLCEGMHLREEGVGGGRDAGGGGGDGDAVVVACVMIVGRW